MSILESRNLVALAAAAICAVFAAAPAAQQRKPIDSVPAETRLYTGCMVLARTDPPKALQQSEAWLARGGGEPARHCGAIALLGVGRHTEAAIKLESLATETRIDGGRLKAELLAQSGQAWLIAGDGSRAYAVQSAALALRPDDVELLVDRSITLGTGGRFWESIDDLNRVLEIQPERADALVFRAAAYRRLDSIDLAETDIERAVALWPDAPDVLLERGNIRRLKSDVAGARADWRRVIELAPDLPAALAARRNLDRADGKLP